MYSALKVNGQKLCDLARAGKEVERKARRVTIHEIRIEKIELPRITMEVTCSKGTYIRTLCQDIGDKLGVGGCMESLLRTRVSRFTLEDSLKLNEVEALAKEGTVFERIVPIDGMFENAVRTVVKENGFKWLINGNPLPAEVLSYEGILADEDLVRVYDRDGRFYALYRYEEKNQKFSLVKMFFDREEN